MLREFHSCFHKEMTNYINHRIKKGYHVSNSDYLYMFDEFLCENNYSNSFISREIIELWTIKKETENKNSRNSRVSTVRQFCYYLNAIGVEAYIPDYCASEIKTVPYVMTYDEIQNLFNHIDEYFVYRKHGVKHYSYVVPVLLRLLYACGLRINEACTLRKDDLINEKMALHLTNTKNKKERLVYMTQDMHEMLVKYLNKVTRDVPSEWFFPSKHGDNHIQKTSIDKYFHNAVVQANIGTPSYYPTPHSLRHTYVVHRVDTWIKENKKLDELMPYLSKQLGHETINETYYYYHLLNTSYESIRQKDRDLFPEVRYEEEQ